MKHTGELLESLVQSYNRWSTIFLAKFWAKIELKSENSKWYFKNIFMNLQESLEWPLIQLLRRAPSRRLAGADKISYISCATSHTDRTKWHKYTRATSYTDWTLRKLIWNVERIRGTSVIFNVRQATQTERDDTKSLARATSYTDWSVRKMSNGFGVL